MSQKETIQLFEQRKVRTIWDDELQEWFFCVVDVVEVLTGSVNPTDYLKKMRKREPELNTYIGTNCPQVLMSTPSGKRRARRKSGSHCPRGSRAGNRGVHHIA